MSPAANPGSLTRRREDRREGALLALPVLCPQEEAQRLCLLAAAGLTLEQFQAYEAALVRGVM